MPTIKKFLDLICCECKNPYKISYYYAIAKRKRGGRDTCASCSNSLASLERWKGYSAETRSFIRERSRAGIIRYNKTLSIDERRERGRKAGSKNTNLAVIKQWESIKADSKKYEDLKKQRSETFKRIWDNRTPEQRSVIVKKALGSRKVSKVCTDFLNSVRAHGVQIREEVPICGFVADGLHDESNTIILFHGDFWHCRPEKYKDPTYFCTWLGRTVGEQWKRDSRMLAAFYKKGFNVFIVWEGDYRKDSANEVNRLLETISSKQVSKT